MSAIKRYKIEITQNRGTLFLFHAEDDHEQVLFVLCVAHDGIYYYPSTSSIVSTGTTKGGSDFLCDISLNEIKKLFEAIVASGLDMESANWKITAEPNKVTIEPEV